MTDRMTFYAPKRSVVNWFDVPKALWNSWSLDARAVFNETYIVMHTYPGLFNAELDEAWQVICWNAACIAANAVNRRFYA